MRAVTQPRPPVTPRPACTASPRETLALHAAGVSRACRWAIIVGLGTWLIPGWQTNQAAASAPLTVAQARAKQSSASRRKRRSPTPPPAPPPAASAPAANADDLVSPAGPGLQRGGRVEFDSRLVQGQTARGALLLLARKRSELRSMVDERTSYRQEILRTVYPDYSSPDPGDAQ